MKLKSNTIEFVIPLKIRLSVGAFSIYFNQIKHKKLKSQVEPTWTNPS